jgi:hypothetical protein
VNHVTKAGKPRRSFGINRVASDFRCQKCFDADLCGLGYPFIDPPESDDLPL